MNTLVRVLAAVSLLAACGGDNVSGPPPAPVATQLSLATQPGGAQNGIPLATQPAVRLRDANGIIVAKPGVVVTATSTGSLVLANAIATTDANGTATFNGLTLTGVIGSYTLSFSASGLTGVSSSAITLSAGAPSQLVVTTQPSATSQAGVALAQQPVVQLRDVSGNDAPQAAVTVSAMLVAGSATVGNAAAVTSASGSAVFAGLTLAGTVGSYTLRFTATGLTPADAAAPITLAAGPATQLALATAPSATVQNGAALTVQPVVQLRDAFGNNATQAGVVVVASVVSGPAGSAIAGDSATTNASGAASFSGLKLTGLVGSYGLRFASAGFSSIVGATALTPGAAAKLGVTTGPSNSPQSGIVFVTQPVVQVQDASGNSTAQAGVVVHATVTGATLTNDSATTDAAGRATFNGLAMSGPATFYIMQFTAPGLTSAASNPINLAAGPAVQLALGTQPALTAQNGIALARQPVVRLQDASGNVVGQANVVVTASVVSGSVTLTAATATTTAGGAATFTTLSLTGIVGSYTLRFSAPSVTSVDAAAPTAVSAGPASQLSLTTQPATSGQSGAVLTTQPVVQLRDVSGNAATGAGVVVTASLVSGTATLTNQAATTNAAGVATFAGFSISGVSGNYALRFGATNLTAVDAAAPTVLGAGAATQLVIVTEPAATAASGVALTTQPVVQLKDGAGNATPQPGIVVTATVVSGTASFTSGTAATDAAGTATFSGFAMVASAGSYTIRFTSGSLAAATAAAPTALSAGPATQLSFATPPPATAQVSVALLPAPAIQLLDGASNAAPQSGTLVTVSVISGSVTLGNATATTNISGVATFASLTMTAVTGNYTLRFTAPSLGVLDAPAATALAAGPAKQLAVITQPSVSVAVATALATQPVLQLRDVAGNPAPQAGVVVTATVVSGTVTINNATATTNASGLATFSGLALAATTGSYTLRFGAPGVTSVNALAATALTVGPAAALALTVQPATTANVGVALTTQPSVQLRDAGGNAVAQAGVLVTVTASGATLANNTATTTGSGVATFSGLALSGPANASYLLTFSASGVSSVNAALQTALNPGAPATITLLTPPPLGAVNNVAFGVTPQILVQDVAGNAVPSQLVRAEAPGATVTNGSATTNAAGIASFPGLALTGQVSGYSVRFCTGSDCNSTLAIVVSPTPTALATGAAAILTLLIQPSTSAQSGVVLAAQPVAHITDVAGNPVAGVTVTATAGAAGVAGGTAITDGAGDAAFSALIVSGLTASYTLHLATTGASANASTATTLSAGPAAAITITTQPSATATAATVLAQQPVVTVTDASGNPVPGVTVTASTTAGVSVNNGSAVTNGSGVATFVGLALTGTANPYVLTFTSGAASQNASTTTVGSGVPLTVTINQQPPAAPQSGVTFAPVPTVHVTDGVSNLQGVVVTATAAGATLANATAVTDVSGIATFTGLTLTGTAPAAYTVNFTAGSVTVSANVSNLIAGTAAKLVMTTPPSATVQNAVALAVQPAVRITDAGGNNVAQPGTTITASLVSGSAVVGNATAITDGTGTATFSGLTLTGPVGGYTLRFGGPSLQSVNAGAPTVVSAGVATKLSVTTQPSFSSVSAQLLPLQPVVQLRDVSGNIVAQAGVNVTATTDSFPASLAGTLTIVTTAAGVAPFTDLLVGAPGGHRLFRFTAPSLTAVSASDTTVVGSPITSGNPIVSGGTVNSETPFAIQVPPGADSLIVTISDPTFTQTADLYVRFGAAPEPFGGPAGTGLYDCFPRLAGANETCKMVLPAAGTWYALVRAFPFSFSNVTLTARVY
jgi:hypothetical protein